MKTRTWFAVPDISCTHCKASIEAAVRPLPGVAMVDVDIESQTVSVDHDGALASSEALVDAIEGVGYEVSERREEALP